LAAAERDLQATAVTAADFDLALASVSPSVAPQDLARMLAWASDSSSNRAGAASKTAASVAAPGAAFKSQTSRAAASTSVPVATDSAAAASGGASAPFAFSANSPFTLGESSTTAGSAASATADVKPLFRFRPDVFSLRDDTDHGRPA